MTTVELALLELYDEDEIKALIRIRNKADKLIRKLKKEKENDE